MNKRGETWAGEVGSLLEEGKEARYINGRKKKGKQFNTDLPHRLHGVCSIKVLSLTYPQYFPLF